MLPTSGPSAHHSPVVSFAPCLDLLQFDELAILGLANPALRQMYLRSNPRFTNTFSSLSERPMKLFLTTKMKSTSRNLWFRLIHSKIPAKVSLRHILELPDDRCLSAGTPRPPAIFSSLALLCLRFGAISSCSFLPSVLLWICKRFNGLPLLCKCPPTFVYSIHTSKFHPLRALPVFCPPFGVPTGVFILIPSPL
ncbi:hypothetical protein [Parasitella parasitica]|uniref:Uncharacterized protein n=1 Tax=Parasitella parasitica TaxID=35722 RepID=A0A0B7NKZ4_9FUNG|nr:hypothetical protein [Parasitella parasitica]